MDTIEEKRETLVIVDANAIVHSSFHGYKPKLDQKGQDQRVLYGLLNTLADLVDYFETVDYLFMVFDPPDSALYRKTIFPQYKANRPPTDPDLKRQRDVAQNVISNYLGLPTVSHPGYEADDIIGSMSDILAEDYDITIVSPDKDLAQLVKPNVRMLRKTKLDNRKFYKFLDEEKVKEDFGVYPNQIADWLALVGDAADNLPGLYRVGKTRAAEYLSLYRSIEDMFLIINDMEHKELKEQLLANKEKVELIRKLATVVRDLPVKDSCDNAIIKAQKIRKQEKYAAQLAYMQNYFSWPEYIKKMFTS